MRKKIILFDIDHTLFDTAVYLRKAFVLLCERSGYKNKEKFIQIASNTYVDLRKGENFNPQVFCKKIHDRLQLQIYPSELEKVWWSKELFKQTLYKDVIEIFEKLYQDKNITIGIFSTGLEALQREKIEQLEKFLTAQHIHIFEEKEKSLKEVIRKYQNNQIFLVDDTVKILQEAKRIDRKVITILMNRSNKHIIFSKEFRPDGIVSSLDAIASYVYTMKI